VAAWSHKMNSAASTVQRVMIEYLYIFLYIHTHIYIYIKFILKSNVGFLHWQLELFCGDL
jgi:hypothetical protein